MQDDVTALDSSKLNKTSVKNAKTASDTDTYSCNYLNKSFIDATTSANLTLDSTSLKKIPFDTTRNYVGNKFSIQSNGIKIGSGVSKVKVTVVQSLQTNSSTIEQMRIELFKNDTSIRKSYGATRNAAYSSTTCTIVAIVDVTENDVLYAYAARATATTGQTLSGDYSTFIVEEM